ncbi:MAG: glycoside hydrolase 43 family protein [Bacteroidales bacterium]|nr:glycoside hydrolase 43 family protein [Bacteroidales bacterium]
MRKWFLLPLLALLLTACVRPRTQCVNPLTYTDIPDNDVIRVGEDYYMVSTTMYFCPGAPVMQSRDLVHWRIVDYIYDCLEDDDVYNLRNGANAYGKGQWATSLRYENGRFWALFIANDQRKTYVYSTPRIGEKWTRQVIGQPFHDASLLFEDGRVYVVWGNGEIRITELEPDLSGVREGGVDQVLFTCPREGYGLRAEGAHVYHIGDWYYVLVIDWPSGGPRTETCWRSREMLGPYEPKTILQGEFDGRRDGVAQGAIVQTQKGDWYAVMFQDHGAVGRIPTLQPVTWTDSWPILGDNTVPVKEFEVNLRPDGKDYVWDSDEFDSDKLALVWQWNHKPLDDCWSLSQRPGWLRLTAGQLATGLPDARNTLTQRTFGPQCTSVVLLDASGLKPGDYAGLSAFQSCRGDIGLRCTEAGLELYYVHELPQRGEDRTVTRRTRELFSMPAVAPQVSLRIRYDFDVDQAWFSYSWDGTEWTELEDPLQMRYTLDYFTGYRSALYCYATRTPGGHEDFDYFRQF